MNAEVHQDPFAAPTEPLLPQPQEFEVAWFDAPARRSSRPIAVAAGSPPSLPPPPPIDDPVADPWFR